MAEAHWLRTLVAGVPLAWWETTLGDGPDKLLGRRFEPADDLVAGWSRAAVAERNPPGPRPCCATRPTPACGPWPATSPPTWWPST